MLSVPICPVSQSTPVDGNVNVNFLPQSQESPYAEVSPPVRGSKEAEAEGDKVTVKNGTKDACFKFLVGLFGLLFFVLIVILLIYVMVRLNVIDKVSLAELRAKK